MTTGDAELDRVIERAVDDGSIFADTHRRTPPAQIGDGADVILEATIKILLPQGAEAMDAITHRLGLSLDILLADSVLESSRMHLDRDVPLASYAEIVIRSKMLAIGESP